MKKTLGLLASAALVAVVLAACGGGGHHGGGGYNPPPPGCTYNCNPPPHVWSHSELANEFVRRVNAEIANFDVNLVKTWTLQSGYIVVYDWQYGTYDAYYVDAFNPGGDVGAYFNAYEDWSYYDLVPEYGGTYWDPITGTRFEKVEASGKNLSKMKALKEAIAIKRVSDKLHAEYGLSAEKSELTARFAYKLKNSPAGTYNDKDYDAFAKELTGSTISEFQKDFTENNTASLASRIQTAAETTGMGPEGVNKLISEMFLE
jgi:hypothetical protein